MTTNTIGHFARLTKAHNDLGPQSHERSSEFAADKTETFFLCKSLYLDFDLACDPFAIIV